MNEVVAYDRISNEIQRRDAFITGKTISEEKGTLSADSFDTSEDCYC